MPNVKLAGVFTSLVTPFAGDALDEDAFRRLAAWQMQEGVDGVAVGAAEGEGWSLSDDERRRLVEVAKEECGAAMVLGAVLANATATARRQAADLTAAGADAILLAIPCYSKPTPSGVLAHAAAVAECGAAVVLANAPWRSAIDLSVATVVQLAQTPGVAGICDASRDLARTLPVLMRTPPSFAQLCGDDRLMTSFALNGGVGAVTAVGNIAPKTSAWLQQACAAGDWRAAQRLQYELADVAERLPTFGLAAALKRRLHEAGRLADVAVRLPEAA